MKIKIALLADLHLPFIESASQYKALEFAVDSINRNMPDVVVGLGDMTACGDINAAEYFLNEMRKIDLPKLFILGNSDIRTKENIDKIKILQSEQELKVNKWTLLGINTADSRISEDDRKRLSSIDENTIVFMHHPPQDLCKDSTAFMENLLENKSYKACVYGHLHCFEQKGNMCCIQALDPDKAIGEPPCVTYMILEEGGISFEFDYFPCEIPNSIENYIGLSCFDWSRDIVFAAENNIKNIELRPGVIQCDSDLILEKMEYWRKKCGAYLSLHMPDYGYNKGITGLEDWKKAIKLANILKVNGVTVHVPKISLNDMERNVKEEVIAFMVNMIKQLPDNCAVGIENMHMTDSERPDLNRRYGYCPEECIALVEDINKEFGYERVGILLDVGHARNNAPYSQKYNLSSWYAIVGKKTVGYHIHQVLLKLNGMENHTAITNVFGPLISYCSFSYVWNHGEINRKPVFLEIRGGAEKYIPSIKSFLDNTYWEIQNERV